MVYIEAAVILALTLFNGLLAMSELAIVSSRRSRLDTMATSGNRGARVALELIETQAASFRQFRSASR